MTHARDASDVTGDQELAIIQIKNCLLVSIQTELHDRLSESGAETMPQNSQTALQNSSGWAIDHA